MHDPVIFFFKDYICKSWKLFQRLKILNVLKSFKYFLSESTLKEFREHKKYY